MRWLTLVLVSARRSLAGGNSLYAGPSAKIFRGRVTAFRVRYQAGGD